MTVALDLEYLHLHGGPGNGKITFRSAQTSLFLPGGAWLSKHNIRRGIGCPNQEATWGSTQEVNQRQRWATADTGDG